MLNCFNIGVPASDTGVEIGIWSAVGGNVDGALISGAVRAFRGSYVWRTLHPVFHNNNNYNGLTFFT